MLPTPYIFTMEKQKQGVRDKVSKQYWVLCQLCGQEIIGRSVNQCDKNLQHHHYFKHREYRSKQNA